MSLKTTELAFCNDNGKRLMKFLKVNGFGVVEVFEVPQRN